MQCTYAVAGSRHIFKRQNLFWRMAELTNAASAGDRFEFLLDQIGGGLREDRDEHRIVRGKGGVFLLRYALKCKLGPDKHSSHRQPAEEAMLDREASEEAVCNGCLSG